MCGAPAHPRLLVAHIQATVAAYYNIPLAEMYSPHRNKEFAHPRQIAMYLSREMTPRSLPEIGRRFGKRDHTTVIHAIRAVKNRIAEDRETELDVEVLRERLAG
jgi:chromosomal replication initiator protein